MSIRSQYFIKHNAVFLFCQRTFNHSLKIMSISIVIWVGFNREAIAQSADYGDAPNNYKGLSDTYGDASHNISSDLYLGNVVPDSEASTQLTSSPSTGDDDDEGDDEDAFVALPNVPLIDPSISNLSLGRKYNLTVPITNNTNGNATLHAWIDFNQNGKFEAGEYQSQEVDNIQDSVSLSWDIPLTTLIGDTHARFRLTTDDLGDNRRLLDFFNLNLSSIDLSSVGATILNLLDGIDGRSVGNATDGEVEDYPVSISVPLFDYGDAPDEDSGTELGDYQTTESDGGPSHVVVDTLGLNFSLGNNIDGDDGSLQSVNADADDLDGTNIDLLNTLLSGGNTSLNDEDGVDVDNLPPLTADAGQTYIVPVTVKNNIPLLDAFVVGYIDFNQDGDFDDAGEKSTTAIAPPVTSVSASASTDGSSTSASGSVDSTGLRTVDVTFAVPAGVTPGETYARFRLGSIQEIVESATTVTVSSSNGEVNNGEVEDYKIAIAAATNSGNTEPTDFGDAPDSYRDASHDITTAPGLYLGSVAPDGEADTQLPSAAAAGDDDDGNDDEDAFVFLPNVPLADPAILELSVGRNYNLTVPVTNTTETPATLHAWIDFNQNGKFEEGEYQAQSVASGQTSVELSWDLGGILDFLNLLNLPLTTLVGDTHARFRLTSEELTDNPGLIDGLGIDERAYGDAADGEVEDYPVNITAPLYDYGDAPDTGTGTGTGNYQTTEGDEGPTHIAIKDPLDLLHLSLGNTVDGDDGSLQNNDANADDADTKDVDILSTVLSNDDTELDDEDGIVSFPPLTATPGQTYTVPVTVRNNIPLLDAFVVGYIDFNQDGDFDDPGEKSATVTVPSDLLTVAPDRIALDTSGEPRTFEVNFTVPAGVIPGNTYARFRLGSIKEIVESATTVAVSTSNGEVNNGEVEDYGVAIVPATPSVTSVGGQLIDDLNYNGLQDEGETGRDGVTFNLFNLQNEPVASTVTANGGFYDFGELPSGEYYLEIDAPEQTILKGSSGDAQSSFNRVTNRTEPFIFTSGNPLIFDAAIAVDTDGDKIADVNERGDRDGDGVADEEEIDPEGFFYEESSGKILTGGSIAVTGPSPNSVNLVDDGADGSYQFFGRETGRYTIAVESPPGYEPSTSCTETAEFFDPTGGEDPTSLGSGEDGNTGVLVDRDCAANTFYLSFDLEPGDPFVINNNLPFRAIAEPIPSPPPAPGNSCEILLINESFEAPVVGTTPPTPQQTFDNSIAIYNENDVPGWLSSADNSIELWRVGSGVTPYEDEQFAEINAYVNGSLYQDTTTTPGSVITWQFAHRGRSGIDTMNLKIGAPGATVAQINPTNGTTSFSTGNSDWVLYQGTYTVPAGQSTTRFEYEAVSTAGTSQSVGNFIDSVRFGPLCDHGDASSNYPVLRNDNGAAHVNDGVTFLGNSVKIELDGQPSAEANGDDGTPNDADNIDDEDGVTFISKLDIGTTASVDVVASVPGYLNAWVDFNNNENWNDPGEQVFTDEFLNVGINNLSFVVPINANTGVTSARFRFSSGGGFGATGIVGDGEVEDYQITVTASDPNLLLVKRITAINPGQSDEVQFNGFVDDGTANNEDNDPNWPDDDDIYLRGEIVVDPNNTVAKPGDEIEYTIYFLSNGDETARNVQVCDVIPDNMTFVANSYGSNFGVTLLNSSATGATPTNLSNAADTDGATFFASGATLPKIDNPPPNSSENLCRKVDTKGTIDKSDDDVVEVEANNNDNGAVVVEIDTLPEATAPGTPANSYGFIRFRAKVK